MSSFGLIEENMELSHIHSAVYTLLPGKSALLIPKANKQEKSEKFEGIKDKKLSLLMFTFFYDLF